MLVLIKNIYCNKQNIKSILRKLAGHMWPAGL